MTSDGHKAISKCTICHKAKSIFLQGFYTPFPTLNSLWEDVRMDLILGMPRTQRGHDSIMAMVNRFPRWHISFHATRAMMLLTLFTYTARRSSGYIVCQEVLCPIKTPNSFRAPFIKGFALPFFYAEYPLGIVRISF